MISQPAPNKMLFGDELIVSLSAVFQGQAIVEMIAFEESNLTNNPQFYFFDGAFTLSKLEEEFFVRSSLSITQSQKLDSAKTSLETQFSNSLIYFLLFPKYPEVKGPINSGSADAITYLLLIIG